MTEEDLDLGLGAEGKDLGDEGNELGNQGSNELGTDLGDEGSGGDETLVPVSELQRRVKQAQKKHDAEIARIKAENQKEIKKATMTQAQKESFDIEERERLIEERELELNNRELKAGIKTKLAEKGLPDAFTDTLVVLGDEELIDAKIAELENHVSSLVNARVKDKISQPEPGVERRGNVKGIISKQDFGKLSYADKEKLFAENEDLYNKLK